MRWLLVLALAVAACGSNDDDDASSKGDAGQDGEVTPPDDAFSFFVASYAALQRLSGSEAGFGGDLRYGEKDGLAGADKICTEIAEASMPGSGKKRWRAFLSVTEGPDGEPVHAKDRVGKGPWYDRRRRLVAATLDDLLQERPRGAEAVISNDLPNEDGVPNHAPEGELVDNHDILTGTNDEGELFSEDWKFTCHDWTSAEGRDGTPRVGHSWGRGGGMVGGPGAPPGMPVMMRRDGGPMGGMFIGPDEMMFGDGGPDMLIGPDCKPVGDGGVVMFEDGGPSGPGMARPVRCSSGTGGPDGAGGIGSGESWMSALNEAGCAPGASLIEMGPPNPDIPTVGSGGGYGGIYCFALKP